MSRRLSQSTASPQALSRKFVIRENLPSRFPRGRRNHLDLTPSQYLQLKGMRRAIASCDSACDWSVERMAAFCGVSYSTFQRNRRVIVDQRGLIVCTERRGTKHRNATNLWTLPQLATPTPLPKMADVLKLLRTDLKTNTRGSAEPGAKTLPVKPEAKAGPAYSRSEENHDPAHRDRVEHNAQMRHHRLERSHQHERWAMRACVGMAHTFTPTPPPTAEAQAEREAFWQRVEANAAAARAEKAEKEQAAAAAQRIRTESCEVCRGSGKRTIDRAGRPAEVTCWDCKLGGWR